MFGRRSKNNSKDKSEGKKISKESIKKSYRLFRYIKPHLGIFSVGFFFLFVSSGAALVFPKLMGDMLDANDTGTGETVTDIALVLIVIFGIQAIASYFRIYTFAVVTHKALGTLRKEVYQHLISLPMVYFSKHRVGELNSRISSDVAIIQETFTITIAELIRQIIIIVGGIVLLSIISVKLTLFMLALIPVLALAAVFFGKFIKKLSKETQDKIAESNTTVEETLQGIFNVKAFVNESLEINRYSKTINEIIKVALRGAKWRGAFASFIIFCLFGAIVTIVWYGATLVQDPNSGFSTGQLISFILYTVFIGASIGGIANLFSQVQSAIGATEHLMDILEEEPEIKNQGQLTLTTVDQLSIDNIQFSYPNRSEFSVLSNVSFAVGKGQHIALVGASGSGKSTIASLLFRFYDVLNGSISINGQNIKEYELSELRTAIGIVPQDVFLFGGTIKENILYGNPAASNKQFQQAVHEANAHDFIASFPEKYDTLVGERGIQLSGGQRQRVAIARTILKDPEILILDEATSSLDAESEKAIQIALDRIMKKRTTITIAHRLSTIKNADQIIVLDHGEVAEQGTHEELLINANGIYKGLYETQLDLKTTIA